MLLLGKFCFSCSTKSPTKLTCGYAPASGASSWTNPTKLDDTGLCWRDVQFRYPGASVSKCPPCSPSLFQGSRRAPSGQSCGIQVSREGGPLSGTTTLHRPTLPTRHCDVCVSEHDTKYGLQTHSENKSFIISVPDIFHLSLSSISGKGERSSLRN